MQQTPVLLEVASQPGSQLKPKRTRDGSPLPQGPTLSSAYSRPNGGSLGARHTGQKLVPPFVVVTNGLKFRLVTSWFEGRGSRKHPNALGGVLCVVGKLVAISLLRAGSSKRLVHFVRTPRHLGSPFIFWDARVTFTAVLCLEDNRRIPTTTYGKIIRLGCFL